MGYKKHTLRLWWRPQCARVVLVPLVTWVAPANVAEGLLLIPSLRYCQRQWDWWPRLIVVDMGYLAAEAKRYCREHWQVAVLTKIRTDMKLVPPYVAWDRAECPQGQPLEWLGYVRGQDRHWFGVASADPSPLCPWCWEAAACPRQFAYAPSDHESLLGLLPLASRPAQALLQHVRPWIEPTQAYEKNQLGLNQMFLNSLRLTWCLALWADAAVLLRTHALLHAPVESPLLSELTPQQGWLDFGENLLGPHWAA